MSTSQVSPEEQFRLLFHDLDAQGVWTHHLSLSALHHVRSCAADLSLWRNFLAGKPETSASGTDTSGEETSKDGLPNDSSRPREKSPATPRTPKRASPAASPQQSLTNEGLRRRKEVPARGSRKDAKPQEGIAAMSAVVRRRLAVASIDQQLFRSVHSASKENNSCYEEDEGMLSGDDGGYTSYTELEDEERSSLQAQIGIYTLLGSNEDANADPPDGLPSDSNGGLEERSFRPASSPKRPRWVPRLGLAEKMEEFIRELRELCEPHRDAAKEESAMSKGVPKNVHRKAVSAASVVEELKEMEYKARIGKFERVEDCISAVSACIGNQDETFAEVLTQIKDRAEKLREECRKRKQRYEAISLARAMTTGVLGADTAQIVTLNAEADNENTDPDSGAEVVDGDSSRTGIGIPFSDLDLRCWPRNDDHIAPAAYPSWPRVPIFESSMIRDESTPQGSETRQQEQNLIKLIGLDNPVMKNVLGMINLRRHREQAFAKLETWSKVKAEIMARGSGKKEQRQGKPGGSVVKIEHELAGPDKTKAQTRLEKEGNAGLKRANSAAAHNASKHSADEYEIKTDPLRNINAEGGSRALEESRDRALGRAVCALMCYHAGYTHTSSSALSILTDVLESFLFRIGQSLTSSRENIDREGTRTSLEPIRTKSNDEMFEAFRLISASGFRGGFPRLCNYVRSDLARVEQSIREADVRLQAQVFKLDSALAQAKSTSQLSDKMEVDNVQEADKTVTPEQNKNSKDAANAASEGLIRLDDAAFMFGYFSDSVHLDVLGSIKVPRTMACGGSPNLRMADPPISMNSNDPPPEIPPNNIKKEDEPVERR